MFPGNIMISIRARLLLWLLIPLSIVAAAVSIETFYSAQKVSKDLNDRTLRAAMLTLSENIVSSSGSLLAENTLEMLTNNLGDEFFYYVRGPRGAFVTGYTNYPRLPEGVELTENKAVFYDSEYRGSPVRVIAMKQTLAGRELNGITTIITWQKNTTREALTLTLFARSLIRLVLLVLAAGTIVWFAVTKGLKPILDLQDAIENRSSVDLTPIRRPMPIELSGIVKSMNSLFERVARSKTNRERFIGNAAHQLRNPMAAIKIQAQTALASTSSDEIRDGLTRIIETTDSTGKMINQMLSSASAHALGKDKMKVFDLADMIRNVTRNMAMAAIDQGQEIALETKIDKLDYSGNEILLQEAVSNLIDNAITHNPPGTGIEVGLEVDKPGKRIAINVRDDGVLISQEKFQELTQPFSTGQDRADSTGLGLSLAKDVAKSHGGMLTMIPDAESGKTISIILPIQMS